MTTIKDFLRQLETQPVIRNYQTTYAFDRYATHDTVAAPRSVVRVGDDGYLASRLANKLRSFPSEAVVDTVYPGGFEGFYPFPPRRELRISWPNGAYAFTLLPKEATNIVDAPPLPIDKKTLNWLSRATSGADSYALIHGLQGGGHCTLDGFRLHVSRSSLLGGLLSITDSYTVTGLVRDRCLIPIDNLFSGGVGDLLLRAGSVTVRKRDLALSDQYAIISGECGTHLRSDVGNTLLDDTPAAGSSYLIDAKFLKQSIFGGSAQVKCVTTAKGYSLIEARSDETHVAYISPMMQP